MKKHAVLNAHIADEEGTGLALYSGLGLTKEIVQMRFTGEATCMLVGFLLANYTPAQGQRG